MKEGFAILCTRYSWNIHNALQMKEIVFFYPNRSSDQERLLKFEEKLETTFCTYNNSDDLEIV